MSDWFVLTLHDHDPALDEGNCDGSVAQHGDCVCMK